VSWIEAGYVRSPAPSGVGVPRECLGVSVRETSAPRLEVTRRLGSRSAASPTAHALSNVRPETPTTAASLSRRSPLLPGNLPGSRSVRVPCRSLASAHSRGSSARATLTDSLGRNALRSVSSSRSARSALTASERLWTTRTILSLSFLHPRDSVPRFAPSRGRNHLAGCGSPTAPLSVPSG